MSDSKNETVAGMGELHGILARALTKEMQADEVSPAMYNTVRQFLKDNGIECMGANNEDVQALTEELPFEADDSARPN